MMRSTSLHFMILMASLLTIGRAMELDKFEQNTHRFRQITGRFKGFGGNGTLVVYKGLLGVMTAKHVRTDDMRLPNGKWLKPATGGPKGFSFEGPGKTKNARASGDDWKFFSVADKQSGNRVTTKNVKKLLGVNIKPYRLEAERAKIAGTNKMLKKAGNKTIHHIFTCSGNPHQQTEKNQLSKKRTAKIDARNPGKLSLTEPKANQKGGRGMSGSPWYDAKGNLVAIHHAGLGKGANRKCVGTDINRILDGPTGSPKQGLRKMVDRHIQQHGL